MSPPEFETALGGLIDSAILGGIHPIMVAGILNGKIFGIHLQLIQESDRLRKSQGEGPNGESRIIKLPPGTRLPPNPLPPDPPDPNAGAGLIS
jgi:hypothetical protein